MAVEHSESDIENKAVRKLSPCFDIYELPYGESLVFSKADFGFDSIPALVSSTGEVFGLEFSVKIKGGPKVGVHNFTNGATGRFIRGSMRYRYRDCQGQITHLTLRKFVR